MKRTLVLLSASAVLAACGGHTGHSGSSHHDPDAGAQEASTPVVDARAPLDAGVDASEAMDGGSPDAGQPHDAGADASPAEECTPGGALPIAGDYVAPNGTEHWLRRSATATTYTVVPSTGAPPALQLFRVTSVCTHHLALAGTSGVSARLDWTRTDTSLRICVRPTSKPNCDAVSWVSLTPRTP
jgi:hypothetical protein